MNIIDKIPALTPNQRKIVIWAVGGILAIIILGIIVTLSVRGKLLDSAVLKVKSTLLDRYDIDFQTSQYKFSGLKTVTFNDIVLLPKDRDTLARIEKMSVSVRIWPLLFGDVKLGRLGLVNSKVTLVKKDSVSNYDFLFKKEQKVPTVQKDSSTNYAALIDGVIKQVFFKIPSDMELSNFEASYQDDSLFQKIRLPTAAVDGGDFQVALFLNDHDAQWNFAGSVNPDKQQLHVEISSENENAELPLLRRKLGLGISFNKIVFDLSRVNRISHDSLTLSGSWGFEDLKVNHPRLSQEDIILPEATAEGQINIGSRALEIDPKSTIRAKDFAFQPYVKFIPKPDKEIELSIHTQRFKAQDFFDAIPAGLFESLEGIKVDGEIAYDLDFKVNLKNPDSLLFSSRIDDKNLKIVNWGRANINSLNTAFTYHAYEDTVLMREIVLGTENPNFTPLSSIAPILRKTLLNTEDPYFYEHSGFEEEAFKLSIITNIKEEAFKRGASTISMQFVKNVFLNRNKTMMRKFEEILLVWLMEASNQVSKDRLFEIYLNVIEWGKNVYGIKEASKYYFGKLPSELTLGESLYLSSIVPRPKTGLASFEYTGHLKPWVMRHFNTYGSILRRRGQLTDEVVPANYGFYQVTLESNLRPPRPKGIVDTGFVERDPQHEAMMREMEQDEVRRRNLLERLFGKDSTNNEMQ